MLSAPVEVRVVSVIGVAVLSAAVAVVGGWRRSCQKAGDSSHCSPNSSTEGRTVTTGSRGADCGSTSCADKTAPNETLHGIVWIGAGRKAEDQPYRHQAGENLWSCHLGISRFHRLPLRSPGQMRWTGQKRYVENPYSEE